METPERNVRFSDNVNMLSPSSDASSANLEPTSSLQYINSQLVAHGFVSSPGISLDGIAPADSQRVVKCLLSLLGQRVEDMSRTEELSTKLRTLTYDHQRLQTLHKSSTDDLASAQREVSLQKNRINGLNRTLQSLEASSKHNMAELQRTRSAMQTLRSNHQAEQKRRDKEVERMTERWAKISDTQAKLSATRSGVRCANLSAVEGATFKPKDDANPLVVGFRESEKSCLILRKENSRLKDFAISAVNEVQAIYYDMKSLQGASSVLPTPFTALTLFPPGFSRHAEDKFSGLITGLREIMWDLPSSSITSSSPQASENEITRLNHLVKSLKTKLETSEKRVQEQASELRNLSNNLAEERESMRTDALAVTVAQQDQQASLQGLQNQLEQERQQLLDQAKQLEKEKTSLKSLQDQFSQEKRKWEDTKMSDYLPPIPGPSSGLESSPPEEQPLNKSARRSRKSSLQISVGKSKSPRRRSKTGGLTGSSKVQPSYQTEYMPTSTAAFGLKPLGEALLPSFALPPASPEISQPSESSGASHPPTESNVAVPPSPIPPTPARAFPMAKQRSSRMVHAYSPARPSPLSRLLLLGNTPENVTPLDALIEEELNAEVEAEEIDDVFPPLDRNTKGPGGEHTVSLAHELGIPEETSSSEDDSPLRGKKPPPRAGKPREVAPVKLSSKPKAKASAPPQIGGSGLEKENASAMRKKAELNRTVAARGSSASRQMKKMTTSSPASSAAKIVGKAPSGAKGPRRIPASSQDAPVHARRS